MFGMLVKMRAQFGQRDALATVLLRSNSDMPGCLSYLVANDTSDADVIWIIETWTGQASHDESLNLPSVQAAIAEARPLIAAVESTVIIEPLSAFGGTPNP